MKEKRNNNPDKVSAGKVLLWNTRPLSFGTVTIIMGFLSMFCTDKLNMPAALVGTLLMASKIVDGITDLLAGWVVDNTHTKLGKGRPYELCLIGTWVCTYALFAANANWSIVAKSIWLLIMYTLIWSIFGTMMNAAETPYIIRAFGSPIAVTKVSAYGGVFITLGCMVVGITLPMLIGSMGATAEGWRKLVAMYAIPLLLIGLLRFLFVPEIYTPEKNDVQAKVTIHDILVALKNNKYIWLLAIVSMIPQAIQGMGATTYYFNVVVGDIAKLSSLQLIGVVTTLVIVVFPTLMKKHSAMELIGIFSAISFVGYIIVFFAGSNMIFLAIAFLFSGLAALPVSYMRAPIIMDIADYNEMLGSQRMEATLSAATNFTVKLGQALGAFLLGILLTVGGYDGSLSVQPDSAVMVIRILSSFIPAALMALSVICAVAYKPLDALLKEKRATEN
ncbi:MFS transporter [Anaerobium acetethylicum]|uniref:Probable glucitol transport protein GutA n=1 Tax=Anaerobium acetethylicum TaxID=1619234 RepID=A0A1D3TX07_9FIRM|nr:MFS transporter [Anaerobium acetethylicum]SCP98828.1 probable glucitol transport protein GutA [Anaerobium acetethylicum]